MKIAFKPSRQAAASLGFTMVEIALCLAVIAFALVAIIGVLPTGLRVQQDSQAETIITSDGLYWIDAIRAGTNAPDDLVNYVEQIDNPKEPFPGPFNSGREIVELMVRTQYISTARVRAISGSAIEKSPNAELAFSYDMVVGFVQTNQAIPDLYDLSLEFRWPVLPNGGVGRNRKVLRTLLYGTMTNGFFEPR